MTIEYTYPEQRPTGAKVPSSQGFHTLDATTPGYVICGNDQRYWVRTEEVPLVCEAMMTLAGHEWPKGSSGISVEDDVQELAERIIARLDLVESKNPDRYEQGYNSAIRTAIRIFREECGVAE